MSEDPIGFRGGTINLFEYVNGNPIMGTDPTGEFPVWDHYWYWYYSKECGKSGIEAACAVNGADQTQPGLERMAQEAFDRRVSSVSGLRFKVGYGDNPNCREAEKYAGYVYGDTFPTNVQKVGPNGTIEESAVGLAKSQPLSNISRGWQWLKSWF